MKIFYAALILYFVSTGNAVTAQAPNWQWAKSAGGDSSDMATAISTDAHGNSYITGSFSSDSITFGNVILTNKGGTNIFITKYDSSGNVIWAKAAGGNSNDQGNSISIDKHGNCYITGFFSSPVVTFGSITLINTDTTDNVFIAKYDSAGNAIWAKSANGASFATGMGISADEKGSSYITGYFVGNNIVFGTDTLTNVFSGSIFVVKYDSSGNVIWAAKPGEGEPAELGIGADAAGNCYVSGSFIGILGNDTLSNPYGYATICLFKYAPDGHIVWAKNATGAGFTRGSAMSVDGRGDSYITGYFESPDIVFGTDTLFSTIPSPLRMIFLVKYDSSGNVIWLRNAGNGVIFGTNDFPVAVDSEGSCYITGFFSESVIGMDTLAGLLVIKYDSYGGVLWAKNVSNYAGYTTGISTDANDDSYITGWYFNATIIIGTDTLWNTGTGNVFIAKLGSTTFTQLSDTICAGSFFNFNGGHLDTTGVYMDTLRGVGGSDSVVILNLTTEVCEGVTNVNLENAISLFPNPVGDMLTIQSNFFATNKVAPVLYDITGKLIAVGYARQGDKFTYNTSSLAGGVYFIRMGIAGNETVKRFVKIE